MEKVQFEISWVSLWRVFFFLVFVVLMFLGRDILLALFLAIIISSGLEFPITLLERRRVPRTIGVIFVFLLLTIAVIIFLYAVVPLVFVNLNTALFNIQKTSGNAWWHQFFDIKATRSINDLIGRIAENFFSQDASPLDVFSQVLGGVSLTISVFIISFYLALHRHGVERFIRALLPADYEESALQIYEGSRRKIGHWFRAQIILSFVMGILVWITLSLLGVSYAPMLGALAGILELVPFVGPIIAGAISVLIGLSTSTTLGIYTLIAFLALQQFESNILVPLLTRRLVGLHPVLVIIALLIGIQLGGFLGALVAVPAAAVFEEAVDIIAEQRRHREAEAEA